MMAGTAALRFSRWVMRRARARRSPPSMRSTSAAGSARRGVASDPAIGERPDSNMPAGDARGGRAAALADHSEARLERRGPSPATFCGSHNGALLAHEHQVGEHLDVVGDLEEQELRHLDAVGGEGRVQLGLHLDVVAREAEALLLLHLLRRELDVHHGGVGHRVRRLLLDREHAVHLGRRLLAWLQRARDLHLPDLEGDPLVALDLGVEVVLAAHVGVALLDAGAHAAHVHLHGGLRVLRLGGIEGERALDALQRGGADEGLERRVAAEASLRVVGEQLEVDRLRGGRHRRGRQEQRREEDGERSDHGRLLPSSASAARGTACGTCRTSAGQTSARRPASPPCRRTSRCREASRTGSSGFLRPPRSPTIWPRSRAWPRTSPDSTSPLGTASGSASMCPPAFAHPARGRQRPRPWSCPGCSSTPRPGPSSAAAERRSPPPASSAPSRRSPPPPPGPALLPSVSTCVGSSRLLVCAGLVARGLTVFRYFSLAILFRIGGSVFRYCAMATRSPWVRSL